MNNKWAIAGIIVCASVLVTEILFDLQGIMYPLLARILKGISSLAILYFIFYLWDHRKHNAENLS
ncbi:hypothetical protein [Sporosarcina sp. A2]|uniref:hypothetical protein n=1 Tax=Sporosarcina sp. A2 TaxID=3393449 RepID=UPI003D7A4BD3